MSPHRPQDGDRPSFYIHGSAAVEQARLSRLNGLINEASLRELDIRGRERILEISWAEVTPPGAA